MFQILGQNKENTKLFAIFTFIIIILLLVTVVYKNDEDIVNKSKDFSFEDKNFTIIKEVSCIVVIINYDIYLLYSRFQVNSINTLEINDNTNFEFIHIIIFY